MLPFYKQASRDNLPLVGCKVNFFDFENRNMGKHFCCFNNKFSFILAFPLISSFYLSQANCTKSVLCDFIHICVSFLFFWLKKSIDSVQPFILSSKILLFIINFYLLSFLLNMKTNFKYFFVSFQVNNDDNNDKMVYQIDRWNGKFNLSREICIHTRLHSI